MFRVIDTIYSDNLEVELTIILVCVCVCVCVLCSVIWLSAVNSSSSDKKRDREN